VIAHNVSVMVIQAGGALTVLAIGLTMLILFRRERYSLPSYRS